MAAAKRFTTEQIVAKLREMEKLQGQGLSIPAACKRLQMGLRSSAEVVGRFMPRTLHGTTIGDDAD
ncbi:MAG: hypothetical protein NVS3B21_31990 [Acidimicrobiales bacterium]